MNTFESEVLQQSSFDAIRLRLASPELVRKWSYGEVLKPETVNYRTQKPERDGLFAERIFGPVKDWECFCGKYKRIRYKGVVCDKCGVEVTRSSVRRERMGHIELASPVSHIWFLRGVPSQVGIILDLSVLDLEKIVYFADFIITRVNEDLRKETYDQILEEFKQKKKQIEAEKKDAETLNELQEAFQLAKKELSELRPRKILSESEYQDLALKYGHIFEASIGAEAIYQLLEELDLRDLEKHLAEELTEATGLKQKKIMKRLKLVRSFLKNGIRPEWMILKVLPVVPADMRPMVQLDGGRFATSDMNDLYRRVINRNNRLKRLIELNAPEVIIRNEKRMLQEAVDALIDNSARHGKTVTASTGQKRMLKSLADQLKGKQGRFRQNLLGKRVDYSGRSVIVVGPSLRLHECGLPKRMALELFKPFVMAKLIERQLVYNVRSANRFIETNAAEVWDIVEEVTSNARVLLNRAPTLHRLGIQAFKPVLIEGKAIQVHPLVCPAFNADFDGDQMAVHVPLTEQAKAEADQIMLASKNLLIPSQGLPITIPSQEIVLGIYYLTEARENDKKHVFADEDEAIIRYKRGEISVQDMCTVRRPDGTRMRTTPGRLILNRIFPEGIPFVNETLNKKKIQQLIFTMLQKYGIDETAILLDKLKTVSLEHVTLSGISLGMGDLPELSEKEQMVTSAEASIDDIHALYEQGLLTKEEKKIKSIEVWTEVKDKITDLTKRSVNPNGPIGYMVISGARGQWAQVTQMVGMKGQVVNPQGETIELPIKSSFKEGFKVLEYFIACHGTRKGMADTALRTANAGYLTRRLIDVAQDVTISEDDCGAEDGFLMVRKEIEEMGSSFLDQIKGRYAAEDIVLPGKRKPIVAAHEFIAEETAREIAAAGMDMVKIRSLLTCRSLRGVCKKCYGLDLGYNKPVEMGTAVGIIAAQSIGEPGTQLTLRTFHSGGVAGAADVTTGLPRVEEIFEARPVKKPGLIAPMGGQVKILETQEKGKFVRQKLIQIHGVETIRERIRIEDTDLDSLLVKEGAVVSKGQVLIEMKGKKVASPLSGTLAIEQQDGAYALVVTDASPAVKELVVPQGMVVVVRDGDEVERGDQLTEGSLNLHELFEYKDMRSVQKYMMKEVQYVYATQGHPLNNKHLEIIIRQMFSRVMIEDAGDSDFVPGDVMEKFEVDEQNIVLAAAKKRPATYTHKLMGITKASLSTSSFLSAASFQETSKVLINAAVSGKVDYLRGLKENVIIGKLIPAGTGLSPLLAVQENEEIAHRRTSENEG